MIILGTGFFFFCLVLVGEISWSKVFRLVLSYKGEECVLLLIVFFIGILEFVLFVILLFV